MESISWCFGFLRMTMIAGVALGLAGCAPGKDEVVVERSLVDGWQIRAAAEVADDG